MRTSILLTVWMAWLGTVSAAQPASPAPATMATVTNLAAPADALTNAPGVVSTAGAVLVVDDKHPLAPGDRVSFQITEDREPPKPLIVTDSGEVDIPYIGRVSVAGKTCKEVATLLKSQLEKEVLLPRHGGRRAGPGEPRGGQGVCLGPGAHPGRHRDSRQ